MKDWGPFTLGPRPRPNISSPPAFHMKFDQLIFKIDVDLVDSHANNRFVWLYIMRVCVSLSNSLTKNVYLIHNFNLIGLIINSVTSYTVILIIIIIVIIIRIIKSINFSFISSFLSCFYTHTNNCEGGDILMC